MLEGASVLPVPALPDRIRLEPLVGRWIEPEAGSSLDIALEADGRLAVNMGGSTVHPTLASDGRLTVTHGTILLAIASREDGTLEIEQDAEHGSVWRRASPAPVLPEDLVGTYESDEMGSRWIIGVDDAGASVQVDGPIARGARWSIDPVDRDLVRILVPGILARGWFDVRLARDDGGRPAGLRVNTNRLRTVEYRRVEAGG